MLFIYLSCLTPQSKEKAALFEEKKKSLVSPTWVDASLNEKYESSCVKLLTAKSTVRNYI